MLNYMSGYDTINEEKKFVLYKYIGNKSLEI